MSALGSVFLGDVQRQRILSTSTPPSSPPPNLSPSAVSHFPDVLTPSMANKKEKNTPSQISPTLSLDLRIRWLETLLYGTKQDGKPRVLENSHASLLRGIEDLQHKIDNVVQGNESLQRFMDHCEISSLPFSGTGLIRVRRAACPSTNTVIRAVWYHPHLTTAI